MPTGIVWLWIMKMQTFGSSHGTEWRKLRKSCGAFERPGLIIFLAPPPPTPTHTQMYCFVFSKISHSQSVTAFNNCNKPSEKKRRGLAIPSMGWNYCDKSRYVGKIIVISQGGYVGCVLVLEVTVVSKFSTCIQLTNILRRMVLCVSKHTICSGKFPRESEH